MNNILRVLKGEKPKETPVWLMRQAGRYLPEYRELRAEAGGFLEAVFNPAMASEITLQPIRRFPQLDAAILFSDILVIPYALGQRVEFVAGEGPLLGPMGKLVYQPETLEPVIDTLRLVKKGLPEGKCAIGFAGSPWTVACYMIAGRNHDEFSEARRWTREKRAELSELIDTVTAATIDYLLRQIAAGADVIQLFESWAGLLAEDKDAFDQWIIAPTKKIVAALKEKHPAIPVIGFPREARDLIPLYAKETGIDAVGLDYNVDLEWANDNLPKNFPVQGNLNPALLVTGGDDLNAAAKNILKVLESRPHIFNLGHGVVPQTPPENVAALLGFVKE